jgi:hypothetical protein
VSDSDYCFRASRRRTVSRGRHYGPNDGNPTHAEAKPTARNIQRKSTPNANAENPQAIFYQAGAGQTDSAWGIFYVFREDGDELIYGGREKFNQPQGG